MQSIYKITKEKGNVFIERLIDVELQWSVTLLRKKYNDLGLEFQSKIP